MGSLTTRWTPTVDIDILIYELFMTSENNPEFDFVRDEETGLLATGLLEASRGNRPSEVHAIDGWLRFKLGDTEYGPLDGKGLLDAFVRIRRDEDVVGFVERWGAFGICRRHALPAEHDGEGLRLSTLIGFESEILPDGLNYDYLGWSRRGRCQPGWNPAPADDIYSEPIERYHYFSRQANAVLRLASALHNDDPGRADDWERLGVLNSVEMDQTIGSSLDTHGGWRRITVLNAVNEWLHIGDVRPSLAWPGSTPSVRFFESTPFGALAVQLLLAVSHRQGLAVCSECATPYFRKKRAPRKGFRNYCDECGINAAWRHAARRKRNGESNPRKSSDDKE